MPDTEDESNADATPEFQEFSKLLLNGQTVADQTKKAFFFTWRGYRACISSELPKFSAIELKRRFDLAMKSIGGGKEFFQSRPLSSSGRSSSSSSGQSSSSMNSEEQHELTQIPETQLPSKHFSIYIIAAAV